MEKRCKKCKKVIPDNYKYKQCEHCRNERNDKLKKVGGNLLSVGLVAITVISGGKFKGNNKQG